MRYWLCYDLGLQGRYEDLFGWLDKHGAKECGENVATFLSTKTREAIKRELSSVLELSKERGGPPALNGPRIYMIDMKHGGKFIFGRRKVAPWTGYAQVLSDSGEER